MRKQTMIATSTPPLRRLGLLATLASAACLLWGAVGAATARADFGIAAFDGSVDANSTGDPFTLAGGHPYSASTNFELNRKPNGQVDGALNRVRVDLPPGLVGDPSAAPKCANINQVTEHTCPASTQVGVGNVTLFFGAPFSVPAPIFNIDPPPGVPAMFAMNVLGAQVPLQASLRNNGDYGITIDLRYAAQAFEVLGSKVTLWGVPADPSHDEDRGFTPDGSGACSNIADPSCSNQAGVPEKPFIRLPTRCTPSGVGLETRIHVESYPLSDSFPPVRGSDDSSFVSQNPPGYPLPPDQWGSDQGPTGCDAVPFDPKISAQPTTTEADSPTGLDVNISVPQNENPDGLAQSDLKKAVVTLPEGMAVNPSSADGLGACSPSQIGLLGRDFPEPSPIRFTAEPARCPNSSKIGTVEIDTPLLEEPVDGSVYLAEQGNKPGHGSNPFDSLLALYIVAEAPERGVFIKLPGEVSPDPATGRLRAVFDYNPQLPFETLKVHFKAGDRAPLVTPRACGTYEVVSDLSPWARPDEPVTTTDSFQITSGPNGSPCPPSLAGRPFDPGFSAGLVNPAAGTSSPFVLRLTRPDGHQEVDRMTVSTPEGLSAVLRGVPLCAAANAQAGTCPAASRVGTSIVGAGAGSSPFYVRGGEVFLSGPYKGAPLSLAIKVPAVAGPFDLGEVIVRAAIHVDPRTARLTVVSDPIPQILEGIPLRVRDIRIAMDRPGFMVAPTNCAEQRITARVRGINGAIANESSRFQVGDCASLGFAPRFRFKAEGGRKATKRNSHPELHATLRATEGDANIDRVRVKLAKGTFLDQDNLSTICTRPQYAAHQCPENTRIGSAIAESPLLDDPLQGPVYLIASDNKLPDLVADLDGIVDIDLYGRIDAKKNRIRNTFDVVPDVPVSRFDLTIDGGRQEGLLVNSHNICNKAKYRRVNVRIDGQNGASDRQRTKVRAKCKRKKGRGHGGHGGHGHGGHGDRGHAQAHGGRHRY